MADVLSVLSELWACFEDSFLKNDESTMILGKYPFRIMITNS